MVFIDFGFLTTLFIFTPESEPLQFAKDSSPLDALDKPSLGIAKPSVSDRDIPITEGSVLRLQNSPKSNPLPTEPTVESAAFAKSTWAKYAYQFPSVAWTIRRIFPLIVTSGSPLPSSVSRMLLSLITTSTTIEPAKWLENFEFSADTKRLGFWAETSDTIKGSIVKSMNKPRNSFSMPKSTICYK